MKKRVISTEKVLKPLINNPKLTKEILVIDENKKKTKSSRTKNFKRKTFNKPKLHLCNFW